MEKAKFILSKSKAIEQYNKAKAISDIVSYSSKTNQEVAKVLEQSTNSMFSVHLENEFKHLNDKTRIIFLAQAWTSKQIASLLSLGIKWFVVDNESDLSTLIDFMESKEITKSNSSKSQKINLLLRLRLKENTIRTEKYFVFGMPSETINQKLKELKSKEWIENLGIHFHRKTQNIAEWNLQYELETIISPDNWEKVDIVNIGGGIPSQYANTNLDVLDSIFKKINELKKWLNQKGIKLIVEPGRFIAAPSVELHANIISIDSNNIIVNASVYNTDMDAILVPVKLLVKGELTREQAVVKTIVRESNKIAKPYVIKGMTPCSMDLFRYRVYLKEPKKGDKLIFLNAGAYNFSSDFCDLEKLETEVVE